MWVILITRANCKIFFHLLMIQVSYQKCFCCINFCLLAILNSKYLWTRRYSEQLRFLEVTSLISTALATANHSRRYTHKTAEHRFVWLTHPVNFRHSHSSNYEIAWHYGSAVGKNLVSIQYSMMFCALFSASLIEKMNSITNMRHSPIVWNILSPHEFSETQ